MLRVLLFSMKVLHQYKGIRLHVLQICLASPITIVPKANSYLDCCMKAVFSLFSAVQPQSQYFPPTVFPPTNPFQSVLFYRLQ